jgi:hypothetical protein
MFDCIGLGFGAVECQPPEKIQVIEQLEGDHGTEYSKHNITDERRDDHRAKIMVGA